MEFVQMTLKAEAPPFLLRSKQLEREKNIVRILVNKNFTEFYIHTRDCN